MAVPLLSLSFQPLILLIRTSQLFCAVSFNLGFSDIFPWPDFCYVLLLRNHTKVILGPSQGAWSYYWSCQLWPHQQDGVRVVSSLYSCCFSFSRSTLWEGSFETTVIPCCFLKFSLLTFSIGGFCYCHICLLVILFFLISSTFIILNFFCEEELSLFRIYLSSQLSVHIGMDSWICILQVIVQ